MTIYRFRSWEHFFAARENSPAKWDRFAISPGGAANRVGVTRQAVHTAINAGRLDAVRVQGGYVLCCCEGVERWRLTKITAEARMRAKAESLQKAWSTRRAGGARR